MPEAAKSLPPPKPSGTLLLQQQSYRYTIISR